MRIYNPQIAKFLSVDPMVREYSSMTPYCFAANNPVKFIDVKGENPGDVIVAFSGADLFSEGKSNTGTAGEIVKDVKKNSPGTDAKSFSSTFWKVIPIITPDGGTTLTIVKETDMDKITQEAFDYIMANKTEKGKIIIYGYSHGGVLANHLAKRLEKANNDID